METIRRLARRIRVLVHGDAVERTLAAELRHHIDCETEELIRRGVPPDTARRQAMLAFGGIEQIKEDVRDARGTRAIEDVAADLRYAARVLRRNPSFTIASVLTFALGIGVATSIFSVVYGVLLRPLPYARPDRLMALWSHDVVHHATRNVVSLADFDAWRRRAGSFVDMAALMPTSITLGEGAEPERIIGAEVSTGYFRLLGVSPVLGRDFSDSDERGALVTILSDALWRRRFGGDPAVIGRVITISGRPCAIAGVMPPAFDPPRFGWLGAQALWFPMVTSPERNAWGRFLLVVGRLRDDVTVEHASAELRAIAARLEAEAPADKGWSASVVPLGTEMTGDARTTLLILGAAVSLLLVMAVTNVGTLTLAAMRTRAHELAIRRAIGATDRRLFRQLFVQSTVLATVGIASGLLVAPLGVWFLLWILPPDIPRVASIRVDAPVLGVTTAAAMLATLVFGTVAAFRGRAGAALHFAVAPRSDLRSPRRTGGGTLTVVEIALAVALSAMAVLMVRSVVALRSVDLGFNPGGVAVARIALPENRYASGESQALFFDRLLERVRAVPGVGAAGLVSQRPLGGLGPATTVIDPSNPPLAGSPAPIVDVRIADAAAFHVLRVPILAGTLFDRTEDAGAAKAIISRSLAQTFWPRGDAVGRQVTLAMYGTLTADVIGVVEDVHFMGPRTPARPSLYLSATRFGSPVRDVVMRADGALESVIPALRAAVAALDGSLPVYGITTLPDLVDTMVAPERFTMYVLIVFALSALFLAAVGVFGVFIGDVTSRRREIGIRLALGAHGGGVVLLLLRGSLLRAAAGIVAGTLLAVLLTRTMTAVLFGVHPTDPLSLASVAALVLGLSTTATLMPAVRAIRRSPLAALREG